MAVTTRGGTAPGRRCRTPRRILPSPTNLAASACGEARSLVTSPRDARVQCPPDKGQGEQHVDEEGPIAATTAIAKMAPRQGKKEVCKPHEQRVGDPTEGPRQQTNDATNEEARQDHPDRSPPASTHPD